MTLADLALDSVGYRTLLFLHILCMIIGFGSTFVYPILGAQGKRRGGVEAKALSESGLAAAKVVTTPVIYAGGAFGLLLAILGPWDLGSLWVSAAIVVFLAAILFAAFVHVPNLHRMDALVGELATVGPPPEGAPPGPPPAAVELGRRSQAAARNGAILQLSLVVLLFLMIWKPGA